MSNINETFSIVRHLYVIYTIENSFDIDFYFIFCKCWQFMFSGLRPEMCDSRPEMWDLRPEMWDLRSEMCDLRPEMCCEAGYQPRLLSLKINQSAALDWRLVYGLVIWGPAGEELSIEEFSNICFHIVYAYQLHVNVIWFKLWTCIPLFWIVGLN